MDAAHGGPQACPECQEKTWESETVRISATSLKAVRNRPPIVAKYWLTVMLSVFAVLVLSWTVTSAISSRRNAAKADLENKQRFQDEFDRKTRDIIAKREAEEKADVERRRFQIAENERIKNERLFDAESRRTISGLSLASVIAPFGSFEWSRAKPIDNPIEGGPKTWMTELHQAETAESGDIRIEIFGMSNRSVYCVQANVTSFSESKCRRTAISVFNIISALEFEGADVSRLRKWIASNLEIRNVSSEMNGIQYDLTSVGTARILSITAPLLPLIRSE